MTFLRRLVAFLLPIVVCRQEPLTIAEMRKASFGDLEPRYRLRYEGDARKLRGSRAGGKVKSFDEWHAKHGRERKSA